MKRKLLVIGKSPYQMNVKTRLAEEVGQEWASRFYKAMIHDLVFNIKDYENHFDEILFSIDNLNAENSENTKEKDYFQEILREASLDVTLIKQPQGSFFYRLDTLINENLHEGEKLILTGTDVPDLPFDSLLNLDENQSWLGPDTDGGFYFAQIHFKDRSIFHQFEPRESSTVTEDLLRLNLGVKTIGAWSDIDTYSDLKTSVCRNPINLYYLRKELVSYQSSVESPYEAPIIGPV